MKILIEDSLDCEHDVRKNDLYDSIEYFVLARDDARNDFDDCLTDLVLDDLEKINVLRVLCFLDVVEIRYSERKEKAIDQTLNFYFFDENHCVVRTTKKERDEFERR
jgi:hypothetical protein